MQQFMMCGADDVEALSEKFSKVVRDFGATPWFFREGTIWHENVLGASFTENSLASVQKADICVFIIVEQFGDTTWNKELEEALHLGKPLILMALDQTWQKLQILSHTLGDTSAIVKSDDRKMVEVFRRLTSDYQLTEVTFTHDSFEERLRSSLSRLMAEGIALLGARNSRRIFLQSVSSMAPATETEVPFLVDLATDEFEFDKRARKSAINRLSLAQVRNDEVFLELCRSSEQGVQRLSYSLMHNLVAVPLDEDTLSEAIEISKNNDDVGITNRLILSLAELDVTRMDRFILQIGSMSENIGRRAFESVEKNWDRVLGDWGGERMARFLTMCAGKAAAAPKWSARLQARLEALEPEGRERT